MSDNLQPPKFLRVVSWNINSFRTRKPEIEELLSRLEVDVMALQETKLSDEIRATIPGFRVFRHDRNTRGGGVALLVKQTLPHHQIPTPGGRLETVGVAVNTYYGHIEIVSCYAPPQTLQDEDDLAELFAGHQPLVAIGDFNAKAPEWNSRTTNPAGRVLRGFLDQQGDITPMGPTEDTYISAQAQGASEVLDIALLKSIPMPCEIETLQEGSSDHNPVLLTLGGPQADPEDTFVKRRTDWDQFRAEMQRNGAPIPIIETNEDLEAAIETFESDIHTIMGTCTTETRVARVTNPIGELPYQTRQLIRERRAAKRRAARTRNPQAKQVLNRLNREVKDALLEHRQLRWQNHLMSLDPQDRSFWKTQRALRTDRRPMPPIQGENGVVCTPRAKAEAFVEALELQCRENDLPNKDQDHIGRVERRARRLGDLDDHEVIRPVTPDEVKNLVRRAKIRKAPGYDNISNLVLKKLPHRGIMAMTNIINAILRLRYFPERWKRADVIFIPKPGKDRRLPKNYRPISLLPAVSKIAERAILARLAEITEDLQVIPDEQFAYRSGHSTELQVLRIAENVMANLNRRENTAAVFLDVAKAFDRVWHDGLLIKLIDAGYPPWVVRLTDSYLRGRTARAKVEGALSTYRRMEAGVPQGAVLSSHLFIIYTSDTPRTARTSMFLYADDTAIIARSLNIEMAARHVQQALVRLEEWCNKWKVSINPDKSSCILFTHKQRHPNAPVRMNGEDIRWSNEVKYLGVTLDKRLTWKTHIENVKRQAKFTRAHLYPLLRADSELSLTNKLLLIKTVLRPQLTYASPAWGAAAKSHLKKIQAVENIALRTATGAPWFMRNDDIRRDLQHTTVTEIISERARKTFAHAETHQNPLIRTAVDYQPDPNARHKRPRLQVDPG